MQLIKVLFTCYLALITISYSSSALAANLIQSVQISSTPNPVGSGARALAMGGAFTAIADDATAASWNPAGLIQLESPEASLVLDSIRWQEDYRPTPIGQNVQTGHRQAINYVSLAVPIALFGNNAVISINEQEMYALDRNLHFSFGNSGSDPSPPPIPPLLWDIQQKIDFKQHGSLRAISPALAVQITPKLALGITINFWQKNRWHSQTATSTFGSFGLGTLSNTFASTLTQKESFTASAARNLHIGMLWEITPQWTLGAVTKTAFALKVQHRLQHESTGDVTGGGVIDETLYLHLPAVYGLGLSWHSDVLAIAIDAQRTQWGSMFLRDDAGNNSNLLNGMPMATTPTAAGTRLAMGLEYLHYHAGGTITPLRAGIYRNPQPTPQGNKPTVGISLGTGIIFKQWMLDIGYSIERGSLLGDTSSIPHDSYQLRRQRLYASCVWHFDVK
ncbi:MAG: outer membrane protein transport protein [Mariprofundales bacterium]